MRNIIVSVALVAGVFLVPGAGISDEINLSFSTPGNKWLQAMHPLSAMSPYPLCYEDPISPRTAERNAETVEVRIPFEVIDSSSEDPAILKEILAGEDELAVSDLPGCLVVSAQSTPDPMTGLTNALDTRVSFPLEQRTIEETISLVLEQVEVGCQCRIRRGWTLAEETMSTMMESGAEEETARAVLARYLGKVRGRWFFLRVHDTREFGFSIQGVRRREGREEMWLTQRARFGVAQSGKYHGTD